MQKNASGDSEAPEANKTELFLDQFVLFYQISFYIVNNSKSPEARTLRSQNALFL